MSINKEILVNLLGYKGTFIHSDVHVGKTVWSLHKDVAVDVGTRAQAESLLVLGPVVQEIRSFLREVREGEGEEAKNLRNKVYASVLCDGVQEVLDGYERDVQGLYSDADEPHMSLPQISSVLSPWLDVLPELLALLAEVQRRPAQILTIVDQTVRFRASRAVFATLQKRLNALLLNHIADFVVWGVLPNAVGFFIEEAERSSESPVLTSLFQPAFIPTHLAILILTVGQYARRMRGTKGGALLREDWFTLHSCISNEESLGDGAINTTLLEDVLSHAEKVVGYQLWSATEDGLVLALRGLGDYLLGFRGDMWRAFAEDSFALIAQFGAHVVAHREATAALTVSSLDRATMRLREKLISAFHMAAVVHKKYARKITYKRVFTESELEAFYENLTFSALGEESTVGVVLQKLTEPVPAEDKMSQSIRFANFVLATVKTYRCEMTLSVGIEALFDAQCKELLNNIFSHHMYLIHTEAMLSKVWRTCTTAEKMLRTEARRRGASSCSANEDFLATPEARVKQGFQLLKPLLLLKNKMSFFVGNLKVYILTDVVHAQYSALRGFLAGEVNTFESARAAIKQCLQDISANAFLVDPDKSNHLVLVTIRQAIRCCLQCWYVVEACFEGRGRDGDVHRGLGALSDWHSVLTELSIAFDKCVHSLYNILSSNAHVVKYRQLLARLNFNKHFSTAV